MPSPIDPSNQFINVTTSDTLLLEYNGSPATCRGILLGGVGDIAIKDDNNTTVVISGLAAAIIHPIATQQILATSTTATDIAVFF